MAFDPPLWQVLRAALTERGISVRRFARMLHDADPRQSFDSWKRTLGKYLKEDAATPMVPSPETARLMAELLGYPEDAFVRPQRRALREQRDQLLGEVARLRALLQEHGISPDE